MDRPHTLAEDPMDPTEGPHHVRRIGSGPHPVQICIHLSDIMVSSHNILMHKESVSVWSIHRRLITCLRY